MVNVGKYTSPMDSMGYKSLCVCFDAQVPFRGVAAVAWSKELRFFIYSRCNKNAYVHENYNTPVEHTPGNPPSQPWKESLYSLLVKV